MIRAGTQSCLARDYIRMPREAGFGAADVVGRGPFK